MGEIRLLVTWLGMAAYSLVRSCHILDFRPFHRPSVLLVLNRYDPSTCCPGFSCFTLFTNSPCSAFCSSCQQFSCFRKQEFFKTPLSLRLNFWLHGARVCPRGLWTSALTVVELLCWQPPGLTWITLTGISLSGHRLDRRSFIPFCKRIFDFPSVMFACLVPSPVLVSKFTVAVVELDFPIDRQLNCGRGSVNSVSHHVTNLNPLTDDGQDRNKFPGTPLIYFL
ncbi:hypothetical protein BGW80DRAFT_54865 [Lactifluus volemus]|jgi:hypothetical protein|nr:hypothetical protein BGW80DRAFT_54865 [Lactifluus volemus]